MYDFMMSSGKPSPCRAPKRSSRNSFSGADRVGANCSNIRIVATADDHDVGHAEITDTPVWSTTFPPQCMRGPAGQLKIAATQLHHTLLFQPVPLDPADVTAVVRRHHGDVLLNKPGTDVFRWNPNAAVVLGALAHLIGSSCTVSPPISVRARQSQDSRASVQTPKR